MPRGPGCPAENFTAAAVFAENRALLAETVDFALVI
jgi:hypothetical protein